MSNPTTSRSAGIPSWTAYDLIDRRITVYAQRSLLRLLKGGPVEQKIAADLITAVKSGAIEGIYVVNQAKPALRARENNTYWWQLIPKGEDITCMSEPAGRPPLLALSTAAVRNNARVDTALLTGWLQLLGTSFIRSLLSPEWPLRDSWPIIKTAAHVKPAARETTMSEEAKRLVAFIDFLMHLYYRHLPNRNFLGPVARSLKPEERSLVRLHAFLLAGNYANSEDLNYMQPHPGRTISGEFAQGDYRFGEITAASINRGPGQDHKGLHNGKPIYTDYGGQGTTCGFICHWMLWRLGCREPDLNRTVYAYSGHRETYEPGYNVCRLGNMAARHDNHIRTFKPGPKLDFCKDLGKVLSSPRRKQPFAFPKTGDIIYLPSPPGGGNEHVFIYLGKIERQQDTYWICAESGQEKYAKTIKVNGKPVHVFRQFSLFKARKEDTSRPFFQVANQKGSEIAAIVPLEKLTYHALPKVEEYYRKELGVSNFDPLSHLSGQAVYDYLVNGWVNDFIGTTPFLQLTDSEFCQLIMDLMNNP